MMKSKRFEPIQEIASNRAGELSRAMRIEAESSGRVVERFRKEERRAAERLEQHDADATALRISLGTRRDTGH